VKLIKISMLQNIKLIKISMLQNIKLIKISMLWTCFAEEQDGLEAEAGGDQHGVDGERELGPIR
jgi:hypothetical protein